MSDPAVPAPNDPPRHRRISPLLFTTFLVAALSLCVAIWRWSPPGGFLRDGDEHPRTWVFVAAVGLLLLLSFFRVRYEKGKRFPLTVSDLYLSVSAVTTLGLCVLFAILLAPHEELLVYILGFAALIIGGQHLVEFDEAQGILKGVNEQLGDSTRKLSKATTDIERRVASLTQTLGYEEYREMINLAYGQVTFRVLACTNHWPIDPTFWSKELSKEASLRDPEFWEGQKVYCNLRQAVRATRVEQRPLKMVFVGRFSLSMLANAPALSIQEFTLFVGILWRLAIAHRLRAEMRHAAATSTYRKESSVRVMVADVPINCHVVDKNAFLLLHLPSNERLQSYGLKLTTPDDSSTPEQLGPSGPSVAEAYAEIIERYTRTHVHSAREYVASLLVMAATANAGEPFGDLVLMNHTTPHPTPDRAVVSSLLDTLGMQAWLDRQSGPYGDIPTGRVTLDREDWKNGAILLLEDFLSHYYARGRGFKRPERAGGRDGDESVLTVDDLVGDLL